MSNENLPKKQTFMDRLKTAFFVIIGRDPLLEERKKLEKEAADLEQQRAELDKKSEKIQQQHEKSAGKLNEAWRRVR